MTPKTCGHFHGSVVLRALALLLTAQACSTTSSSDADEALSTMNLYSHPDSINTRVIGALAGLGEAKEVDREQQAGWTWTEHQLFDETYPLTIDVVASSDSAPTKVVYFFPGGATNFHATYFVPHADNVAHYFRERGYVVIGITPREESVPADVKDVAFMASWGIAKHRADVRRVIEAVQGALSLPYEVLGHSYGGSLALDYAASYSSELARLVILDIYAFDPGKAVQSIRNAERSYAANSDLLSLGMYADTTGEALSGLATWSAAQRKQDSGIPRALFGSYPGNFTNEGLYYFGLIETAQLPGTTSLLNGLKADWPMVKGLCSGTYTFANDPQNDTYAVTHVSAEVLTEGSRHASRGSIPAAFSRDYWAAVAGSGPYRIDWSAIKCPLTWINTELGYAEQFYGALAARAAGNDHVTTGVVAGYGHTDIFLGRNARTDVWPMLVP